jgi:hypothetical protein
MIGIFAINEPILSSGSFIQASWSVVALWKKITKRFAVPMDAALKCERLPGARLFVKPGGLPEEPGTQKSEDALHSTTIKPHRLDFSPVSRLDFTSFIGTCALTE